VRARSNPGEIAASASRQPNNFMDLIGVILRDFFEGATDSEILRRSEAASDRARLAPAPHTPETPRLKRFFSCLALTAARDSSDAAPRVGWCTNAAFPMSRIPKRWREKWRAGSAAGGGTRPLQWLSEYAPPSLAGQRRCHHDYSGRNSTRFRMSSSESSVAMSARS
jgi:hypothetical protein